MTAVQSPGSIEVPYWAVQSTARALARVGGFWFGVLGVVAVRDGVRRRRREGMRARMSMVGL